MKKTGKFSAMLEKMMIQFNMCDSSSVLIFQYFLQIAASDEIETVLVFDTVLVILDHLFSSLTNTF